MLDNHIEPYQECWDQGFWNELYKDDFEQWPLIYNWKAYWGINDDAVIVHFHGFKLGDLKENDPHFCADMMNAFPGAYEGWLYYMQHGFRVLGYDKDLYITKLASYLNSKKENKENKKMWYFSTYLMHLIYVKFKNSNFMLTKSIYKYAETKLKKRHII